MNFVKERKNTISETKFDDIHELQLFFIDLLEWNL